MVKRFLKNIEYKTKKGITMDTKIFLTYRIFIVLSVIAIIKRIMMVRKASKNTKYYADYVFWICTALSFLNHLCFVLLEFGNFYSMSLDDLGTGHLLMMCYFFIASVCCTIGQFIFSKEYVTYNIVYNKKIKRKPQTINYDESFIVLHKLFKNEKILVKDIVVDESCYYSITYACKSKLFPLANVLADEEYAVINLTNKKKVKIQGDTFFLQGAMLDLFNLAKALNIQIKRIKK